MTEIAVEAARTPAQLPNVRVAVLGAGKMGGILVQAFLKQNLFAPDQIHATMAHAEKALSRSAQWGIDVSTDNLAAAQHADLILIGVKPFQVPDLVAEIRPALTPKKTLVSFAASVKTSAIEDAAGMEIGVIRAMPNTPSALGAGAAGLCRGRFVTPSADGTGTAHLRDRRPRRRRRREAHGRCNRAVGFRSGVHLHHH